MKAELSVQLKDVLARTINAWVDLFDESNKDNLPQLCMELVYENYGIVFNPSYEHLEELILFVVQQIAATLQSASALCVNFVGHKYGNLITHNNRLNFFVCLTFKLTDLEKCTIIPVVRISEKYF